MTDQELIITETDDGKDYTFYCFCTHHKFSITENIKKYIKAGKKIPGGLVDWLEYIRGFWYIAPYFYKISL